MAVALDNIGRKIDTANMTLSEIKSLIGTLMQTTVGAAQPISPEEDTTKVSLTKPLEELKELFDTYTKDFKKEADEQKELMQQVVDNLKEMLNAKKEKVEERKTAKGEETLGPDKSEVGSNVGTMADSMQDLARAFLQRGSGYTHDIYCEAVLKHITKQLANMQKLMLTSSGFGGGGGGIGGFSGTPEPPKEPDFEGVTADDWKGLLAEMAKMTGPKDPSKKLLDFIGKNLKTPLAEADWAELLKLSKTPGKTEDEQIKIMKSFLKEVKKRDKKGPEPSKGKAEAFKPRSDYEDYSDYYYGPKGAIEKTLQAFKFDVLIDPENVDFGDIASQFAERHQQELDRIAKNSVNFLMRAGSNVAGFISKNFMDTENFTNEVFGGMIDKEKQFLQEMRQVAYQTEGITIQNKEMLNQYSNIDKTVEITGVKRDDFQDSYAKKLRSGIRDLKTASSISKAQLNTEKQLGIEAGSLNDEFTKFALMGEMNEEQIAAMGRGMREVARNTGLTGEAFKAAISASGSLIKNLRNTASLTASAAKSIIGLMASAQKFDIQDKIEPLTEAMIDPYKMLTETSTENLSLLYQIAGSVGKVQELRSGQLANPEGFKAMATGVENVLKKFGVESIDSIDQLSVDQRNALNIRLKSAFGMGLGELKALYKTYQESGKTFSDKIADIKLQKAEANLTAEETTKLAEEERALRLAKSQEILTIASESAKGAADMSQALDKFGSRSGEFSADLEAMGIDATSNADILRGAINSSVENLNKGLVEAGKPEVEFSTSEIEKALKDPAALRELTAKITEGEQKLATAQQAQLDPANETNQLLRELNDSVRSMSQSFISTIFGPFMGGIAKSLAWISVGVVSLMGLAKGIDMIQSTLKALMAVFGGFAGWFPKLFGKKEPPKPEPPEAEPSPDAPGKDVADHLKKIVKPFRKKPHEIKPPAGEEDIFLMMAGQLSQMVTLLTSIDQCVCKGLTTGAPGGIPDEGEELLSKKRAKKPTTPEEALKKAKEITLPTETVELPSKKKGRKAKATPAPVAEEKVSMAAETLKKVTLPTETVELPSKKKGRKAKAAPVAEEKVSIVQKALKKAREVVLPTETVELPSKKKGRKAKAAPAPAPAPVAEEKVSIVQKALKKAREVVLPTETVELPSKKKGRKAKPKSEGAMDTPISEIMGEEPKLDASKIKDRISNFGTHIQESFIKLNKSLDSKAVLNKTQTMASDLGSGFTTLKTSFDTKSLKDKIINVGSSVKTGLATSSKGLRDTILSFGKTTEESTKSTATKLKPSGLKDKLFSFATGIIGGLGAATTSLDAAGLASSLTGLGQETEGAISDLTTSIDSVSPKSGLASLATSIVGGITGLTSSADVSSGGFTNTLKSMALSFVSDATGLSDVMEASSGGITDVFKSMALSYVTDVTGFSDILESDTLFSSFDVFGSGMLTGFNSMEDAMDPSGISGIFENYAETFFDEESGLETILENGNISESIGKLKTSLKSSFDGFMGGVSSVGEGMKKGLSGLKENIMSSISSLSGGLSSSVTGVKDSVMEGVGKLKGIFKGKKGAKLASPPVPDTKKMDPKSLIKTAKVIAKYALGLAVLGVAIVALAAGVAWIADKIAKATGMSLADIAKTMGSIAIIVGAAAILGAELILAAKGLDLLGKLDKLIDPKSFFKGAKMLLLYGVPILALSAALVWFTNMILNAIGIDIDSAVKIAKNLFALVMATTAILGAVVAMAYGLEMIGSVSKTMGPMVSKMISGAIAFGLLSVGIIALSVAIVKFAQEAFAFGNIDSSTAAKLASDLGALLLSTVLILGAVTALSAGLAGLGMLAPLITSMIPAMLIGAGLFLALGVVVGGFAIAVVKFVESIVNSIGIDLKSATDLATNLGGLLLASLSIMGAVAALSLGLAGFGALAMSALVLVPMMLLGAFAFGILTPPIIAFAASVVTMISGILSGLSIDFASAKTLAENLGALLVSTVAIMGAVSALSLGLAGFGALAIMAIPLAAMMMVGAAVFYYLAPRIIEFSASVINLIKDVLSQNNINPESTKKLVENFQSLVTGIQEISKSIKSLAEETLKMNDLPDLESLEEGSMRLEEMKPHISEFIKKVIGFANYIKVSPNKAEKAAKKVSTILGAVGEISEQIIKTKDSIVGFSNTDSWFDLTPDLNKSLKKGITVFDQIRASVKTFILKIMDFAKNLGVNASDAARSAKKVSEIFMAIGSISEGIMKTQNSIKAFAGSTSFFSFLETKPVDAMNAGIKAFEQMKGPLKAFVQEIFTLANDIQQIAADQDAATAADVITGTLTSIGTITDKVLGISDVAKKIADSDSIWDEIFGTTTVEAIQSATQSLLSVKEPLKNFMLVLSDPSLVTDFGSVDTQQISESIGKTFTSVFSIMESISKLKDKMLFDLPPTKGILGIFEKYTEFLLGISNSQIKETISDYVTFATDVIGEIDKKLSTVRPEAFESIEKNLKSASETLTSLGPIFQEFGNSIAPLVGKVDSGSTKAVELYEAIPSIKQLFIGTMGFVASVIASADEVFASVKNVTDTRDKINSIAQIMKDISSSFSSLESIFIDLLSNDDNELGELITENSKTFKLKFSQIAGFLTNGIINPLAALPDASQLETVGSTVKNISPILTEVTNLINGLEQTMELVASAKDVKLNPEALDIVASKVSSFGNKFATAIGLINTSIIEGVSGQFTDPQKIQTSATTIAALTSVVANVVPLIDNLSLTMGKVVASSPARKVPAKIIDESKEGFATWFSSMLTFFKDAIIQKVIKLNEEIGAQIPVAVETIKNLTGVIQTMPTMIESLNGTLGLVVKSDLEKSVPVDVLTAKTTQFEAWFAAVLAFFKDGLIIPATTVLGENIQDIANVNTILASMTSLAMNISPMITNLASAISLGVNVDETLGRVPMQMIMTAKDRFAKWFEAILIFVRDGLVVPVETQLGSIVDQGQSASTKLYAMTSFLAYLSQAMKQLTLIMYPIAQGEAIQGLDIAKMAKDTEKFKGYFQTVTMFVEQGILIPVARYLPTLEMIQAAISKLSVASTMFNVLVPWLNGLAITISSFSNRTAGMQSIGALAGTTGQFSKYFSNIAFFIDQGIIQPIAKYLPIADYLPEIQSRLNATGKAIAALPPWFNELDKAMSLLNTDNLVAMKENKKVEALIDYFESIAMAISEGIITPIQAIPNATVLETVNQKIGLLGTAVERTNQIITFASQSFEALSTGALDRFFGKLDAKSYAKRFMSLATVLNEGIIKPVREQLPTVEVLTTATQQIDALGALIEKFSNGFIAAGTHLTNFKNSAFFTQVAAEDPNVYATALAKIASIISTGIIAPLSTMPDTAVLTEVSTKFSGINSIVDNLGIYLTNVAQKITELKGGKLDEVIALLGGNDLNTKLSSIGTTITANLINPLKTFPDSTVLSETIKSLQMLSDSLSIIGDEISKISTKMATIQGVSIDLNKIQSTMPNVSAAAMTAAAAPTTTPTIAPPVAPTPTVAPAIVPPVTPVTPAIAPPVAATPTVAAATVAAAAQATPTSPTIGPQTSADIERAIPGAIASGIKEATAAATTPASITKPTTAVAPPSTTTKATATATISKPEIPQAIKTGMLRSAGVVSQNLAGIALPAAAMNAAKTIAKAPTKPKFPLDQAGAGPMVYRDENQVAPAEAESKILTPYERKQRHKEMLRANYLNQKKSRKDLYLANKNRLKTQTEGRKSVVERQREVIKSEMEKDIKTKLETPWVDRPKKTYSKIQMAKYRSLEMKMKREKTRTFAKDLFAGTKGVIKGALGTTTEPAAKIPLRPADEKGGKFGIKLPEFKMPSVIEEANKIIAPMISGDQMEAKVVEPTTLTNSAKTVMKPSLPTVDVSTQIQQEKAKKQPQKTEIASSELNDIAEETLTQTKLQERLVTLFEQVLTALKPETTVTTPQTTTTGDTSANRVPGKPPNFYKSRSAQVLQSPAIAALNVGPPKF